MNATDKTFFAPQLYIKNGVTDISFYSKAFGAVELLRFNNDDGTLHVAELSIDGAIFHVHEETARTNLFSPEKHNGTTTLIGLFTTDVHGVIQKAVEAGATLISPEKDYG